MLRNSLPLLAAFACAQVVVAPVARADGHGKQQRFVGVHPIPKAEGGGICYIEGPHVHIYGADKVQYRDHRGQHYFVGDPVAYGFDGPKVSYKGPHPIHVDAVVEDGGDPDTAWCYLEGPHFHAFAPQEGPEFKLVGGAYFFVGEPPKAFVEARPAMVKINAMYTPLVYERPVVTVDAPEGWIGARVDIVGPQAVIAAPGVVVTAPGVVVVPPSVDIRVPMPSVHIGVGVGVDVGTGVMIQGGGKVHHDNGWHRGGRHK